MVYSRKSFKQRYLENKITTFSDDLANEVELWHLGSYEEPLHTFLGFNEEEYSLCLLCEEKLEEYLKTLKESYENTSNK